MIWVLILFTMNGPSGGSNVAAIEFNSEEACLFAKGQAQLHARAANCAPKGLAPVSQAPICLMPREAARLASRGRRRRVARN